MGDTKNTLHTQKTKKEKGAAIISKATLKRLPIYYTYLKSLENDGVRHISSTVIADHLRMTAIQVRKDLASVSSSAGKARIGFEVMGLIEDISKFLRYDNTDEAVLIGVGQLGRTLLAYDGFNKYSLNIVAGFECDPNLVGLKISGKTILSIDKLENLVKRLEIKIGIIAVPKENAQEVCDLLVNAGILAIWNFAPIHLNLPPGILIKNENLASSFAHLSNKLANLPH